MPLGSGRFERPGVIGDRGDDRGDRGDGVRLGVASEHPGVNSNLLAPVAVDLPSGNAVLNGIPVEVTAADREPALA